MNENPRPKGTGWLLSNDLDPKTSMQRRVIQRPRQKVFD